MRAGQGHMEKGKVVTGRFLKVGRVAEVMAEAEAGAEE